MWISGNIAAISTANTVIDSAPRFTALRHLARNRNRIAEISVPACAMPTQNTKVVMYTPHMTGCVSPVGPMPQ